MLIKLTRHKLLSHLKVNVANCFNSSGTCPSDNSCSILETEQLCLDTMVGGEGWKKMDMTSTKCMIEEILNYSYCKNSNQRLILI